MDLDVNNLEDGRWITSKDYEDYGNNIDIVDCQPRSLLVGESETISSVTSHFGGGVKGYVSFIINDDTSSIFTISWEVPTIGPPKYEFNFLDKSSNHKYDVIETSSFDDTVYQVTIDKSDKNIEKWLSLIILIIISLVIGYFVYRSFTPSTPVEPEPVKGPTETEIRPRIFEFRRY